ncbi:hypothetical protein MTBBW1_1230036 [Desulfamplus magnetovallimortis]|uniref:Uncharacterized protein n=1 Tax=Desulfamplus magnetovallimortis TaxID=1246637 RepID=A0A1W1H6Q6_9BACT|nr:hypothetical protein MTBBW1_1230036 [Desulfamplus magnetovallimortis]
MEYKGYGCLIATIQEVKVVINTERRDVALQRLSYKVFKNIKIRGIFYKK